MSKKIKDENGNVYVKKTPFYKKWWFILLVVLIAYGAVTKGGGSITSNNSTSNSTATQTTSSTDQATNDKKGETAVSEESNSTEKKSVAQAMPKIGEVTKVGDVEYIVNSYRNKQGYTFRLYVTKEKLPHQFTNLHPIDSAIEEYTIGGRIVTVQRLSDEGDKALNFYLTSDDWYGYKLMGLIVYENQEMIDGTTSDIIQEILEKLLKDH